MQTNPCSLKTKSLICTSVFAERNCGQRSYRDLMFTNLSLLGFWTQCVDFNLMWKIEFNLFMQQSNIKSLWRENHDTQLILVLLLYRWSCSLSLSLMLCYRSQKHKKLIYFLLIVFSGLLIENSFVCGFCCMRPVPAWNAEKCPALVNQDWSVSLK